MTTRLQVLRSSTTNVLPVAGSRLPGELWVNLADFQLGVIDASKNAQKLVAVRYFQTTASYAAGDFVVQAGALYAAKGAVTPAAFNPGQWTYIGSSTDPNGPFLPLAGGTLTGALTLNADPGAALGAATKQYVDGKVSAAPFLPLAGGTMLAPITLSGPPTIPLHAATKAYVDSGAFVPLAGGTMTGPLVLAANPAAPLQPATKQYVDALPAAMNDNRLINGDMRIDQRNNGASGTAAVAYSVDRWTFSASQASKGTWGRNLNAVAGPIGFPYYLGFQSSSAYTVVAADSFQIYQPIEADMVSDFAFGTVNAQSVTLSFWARSSLTGTFGGTIQNYASTRSYPFSFSLPTANTWTKITVNIPGDTAGTWVMSGNVGSMYLVFDLGTGSTLRGSANAWAATNYVGVTGAVSVVGTNAATFYVTGVKLEVGSVATPFNRQSLAKSMADCQRYYQVVPALLVWMGYVGAGASFYNSFILPAAMRATPTVVLGTATGVTNCTAFTAAMAGINNLYLSATATAANAASFQATTQLSAEL